jgi:hypothetical protein
MSSPHFYQNCRIIIEETVLIFHGREIIEKSRSLRTEVFSPVTKKM